MATPAEVENDLRVRSRKGVGMDVADTQRAMSRAADTIAQLRSVVTELEQAAQSAEDRFEAYRNGADI